MECIELKDYIADNIMKPEDVDKICKDLAEEGLLPAYFSILNPCVSSMFFLIKIGLC